METNTQIKVLVGFDNEIRFDSDGICVCSQTLIANFVGTNMPTFKINAKKGEKGCEI